MAGAVEEPVSPTIMSSKRKRNGVGDTEDEAELIITEEGEVLPRDIAERDAETSRIDVVEPQDGNENMDEDKGESQIKARRAPTSHSYES